MKSLSLRPVILGLIFALLFSASANAQQDRINLNLQNATLKQLFTEIEKQTDLNFSYRDSEIEGKGAVNIVSDNLVLSDVLNTELDRAGLQYTAMGNKIIVTPKQTYHENITVKGRIVDSNGEPVISASALVKGTKNGVITDIDGKFSITVRKGDTIEFASLGYTTQEYRAVRNAEIEIKLEDDSVLLEEAVAVGYGTTSRKNLTTSVATIKTDKITKSATSNMSQMLMGKAAGLRANISSPQPGGNVDVSIRGGGNAILSTSPGFHAETSIRLELGLFFIWSITCISWSICFPSGAGQLLH